MIRSVTTATLRARGHSQRLRPNDDGTQAAASSIPSVGRQLSEARYYARSIVKRACARTPGLPLRRRRHPLCALDGRPHRRGRATTDARHRRDRTRASAAAGRGRGGAEAGSPSRFPPVCVLSRRANGRIDYTALAQAPTKGSQRGSQRAEPLPHPPSRAPSQCSVRILRFQPGSAEAGG